ncbi:MAG: serine/threonine protein phosphatase, partial [Bacteroidales bacterium]|nr:serine/threonine protein phosphatase [Bacteroidales bacterium]
MKRILLICLIALVSVTLAAKKITGNVHCGEQMLQGVTVTDGVHFATTDRDGFFRLKIDKNSRFVYIVTPSGYTADYSSG